MPRFSALAPPPRALKRRLSGAIYRALTTDARRLGHPTSPPLDLGAS